MRVHLFLGLLAWLRTIMLEDTLTLLCLGKENIDLDDFDVKLRIKLLCTLFF
jgi:hypothetical protein